MNYSKRGFFGTAIWSLFFYLALAFAALYLGIGIAFLLVSIRHILLGIPKIYIYWRRLILGKEQSNALPPFHTDIWPSKYWIFDTLLYTVVTIAVLGWFNYMLAQIIFQ